MTLHKSLKSKNSLKRARNVMTRAERLAVLVDDGRWTEEKSVFGLPKVRSFFVKRRHAKTEKKEEAAAEGAEAAAPAAAAPAGKGAAGKGAPAGKAAPAAKAPAGKAGK
jgi:small basic protein (TIGR04137 family)